MLQLWFGKLYWQLATMSRTVAQLVRQHSTRKRQMFLRRSYASDFPFPPLRTRFVSFPAFHSSLFIRTNPRSSVAINPHPDR
jgi:hypothetical protein